MIASWDMSHHETMRLITTKSLRIFYGMGESHHFSAAQ
jgi:hypothetical protein